MQDLFGGGVRRPVAKEALALDKRSRVGKAQAQVKPIKFKCHACAEQMHANTLLQVPGDGTNELRVGLDWERRGLESGLGDVLRRKLDEVTVPTKGALGE